MVRDSIAAIAENRMHPSVLALMPRCLAWMPPAAASAWIWLMPSTNFSTLPVLVPAATVVVLPRVPLLAGAGAGRAGDGAGWLAGGPGCALAPLPLPAPGVTRCWPSRLMVAVAAAR